MWVKFSEYSKAKHKKSPFYFVFSLICTTFATKFKKNGKF